MSYEFEGTPGPWCVHDDHPRGSVLHVGGKNYIGHNETAMIVRVHESKEEESNARAIAAVPELIEALKQALCTLEEVWEAEWCYTDEDEIARIRAVLAKATGENQ